MLLERGAVVRPAPESLQHQTATAATRALSRLFVGGLVTRLPRSHHLLCQLLEDHQHILVLLGACFHENATRPFLGDKFDLLNAQKNHEAPKKCVQEWSWCNNIIKNNSSAQYLGQRLSTFRCNLSVRFEIAFITNQNMRKLRENAN